MSPLGRTDSRLRMVAILLIFAVFGSAAMLRLGYWQVVAADEYAARAVVNMTPTKVTRLARAPIVDRNGDTLAQSITFDQLDAYPSDIDPEDREGIVTTLAGILGLDAAEQDAYRAILSNGERFARLRYRLTQRQSAAVRVAQDDGLLPGIGLNPKDARQYPRKGGQAGTSLASQLLGFVRADGRGGFGVEGRYDDRLTGRDRSRVDVASIEGADLDLDLDAVEVPPLRLTIDAKLQRQVEKELNTVWRADRAKSVSAVIIDPYTGAILALASVPAYDANQFAKVAQDKMSLLRNRVVSDMFEPGSVMKIFTTTAAIEAGKVTPQTRIQDEPSLKFYKYTIWNSDKKALRPWPIPVKEGIAYSRNVIAAKIAQRLAPKSTQRAAHMLYDFWDRVGLVGKTGVDVAAEASGRYWDPDQHTWAPVDLADRAFGQGVGVTLIQLARGLSTLVNGGFLVQPHVVADGAATQVPKQRVLRAKVARQAQDMLEYVTGAVPWYADGALIPGYLIGGKTGTAQIWDSRLGKWKDKFNHNFVGFIGSKRPEIVIALRIEEAHYQRPNGYMSLKIESYEAFQMVARAAIKKLHIRKSPDKNAGLPIIGTRAAEALTPERNRQAKQQARQKAAKSRSREKRTRERGATKVGSGKAERDGNRSGASERAVGKGDEPPRGSEP